MAREAQGFILSKARSAIKPSAAKGMNKGEVLIYQGKDGHTQVSVRLEEETVWLNQNQLAELFQTTKQNVGQHIKNILGEGELEAEGTVKEFFTVAREGRRNVKRSVEHYNLDMIISVGYRVNSHVGVHFRRWATERLRECIIRGFVLICEERAHSVVTDRRHVPIA